MDMESIVDIAIARDLVRTLRDAAFGVFNDDLQRAIGTFSVAVTAAEDSIPVESLDTYEAALSALSSGRKGVA